MPKPDTSKQIIKDQSIVEDTWRYIDDNDAITDSDIIISATRWKNEKDKLQNHNGKLGVLIEFDNNIDDIKADLEHFELIAIQFKTFADGRGYSYATLLRRMGWTKEIRATGDVLRDQVFYMHRCGFTAFEIRQDRSIEDALKAFSDFSIAYQPAIINP